MEPLNPPTINPPGEIRSDAGYTLPEFKRRWLLNDDAIRKAKRKGLKLRTIGRRKFVLGKDALAFLESLDAGK